MADTSNSVISILAPIAFAYSDRLHEAARANFGGGSPNTTLSLYAAQAGHEARAAIEAAGRPWSADHETWMLTTLWDVLEDILEDIREGRGPFTLSGPNA